MPLSEDEQRILREIEANLSVTDPKLVQQVSDTTLYRHSSRMIKWAVLGFVAGLLLDLVPPADHEAGRWALALVVVG
jgi:hypothetical protein